MTLLCQCCKTQWQAAPCHLRPQALVMQHAACEVAALPGSYLNGCQAAGRLLIMDWQ